jgi:hypothetical protein
MSSSFTWNPYGGVSDEDEAKESRETALPRPFTDDEDAIILQESQAAGKSCRQIAKLLPDRSRMSINKRLKKLLRIAKSKERLASRLSRAAQTNAGAAIKLDLSLPQAASVRTPRPKGSKSRWYPDDDEYLRKGGSVEHMAAKYDCSVDLVKKRKKALELKDREDAVNARRLLHH